MTRFPENDLSMIALISDEKENEKVMEKKTDMDPPGTEGQQKGNFTLKSILVFCVHVFSVK